MGKLRKEDIDIINQITRDRIGVNTLERYTGSSLADFQPYILLTNFPRYVEVFAETFSQKIHSGPIMTACHSAKNRISIVNFGIGSPVAALIIELLAFAKPKATLMLGLCGGLRDEYKIGEYFNPVAAIREEGTSFTYLPERCPSLSSFVIQRAVCEELERKKQKYHSGVIHTTNIRFWEFKKQFIQQLEDERAQAIDMECATLFTVGFANYVPVGALMLISDLPLNSHKIKTKEKAETIFAESTSKQIEMGINIMKNMQEKATTGLHYQF